MATGYFGKALRDYASGKRPSTEMEPYAKMAVQLGVDEVAGYFAPQKRKPTSAGPDGGSVARGKVAAAQCAVCHSADGRGDAARNIPDLRAQPEGYLVSQILLFKAERRSLGNEALTPLKAFMKTVSDQTAADLAAYFASQR